MTFGMGQYVYGYSVSGRVTMHQWVINPVSTVEADYQWDNRGRMRRCRGLVVR